MHYDKYSKDYDSLQAMTGFNDPFELVTLLVGPKLNVSTDSKTIDFGCGTGLAGSDLHAVGFREVYGLDGSSDMLGVAGQKNVYKGLWTHLVGCEPLPEECPTDCDLVIASACMIKGHFPNTCFAEMLSALKAGGMMAFTIRDIYLNHETDNEMKFKDAIDDLVNNGKMELVLHERYTKYKGL